MEIKILGSGCSKCKALTATVEKAVEELAIDANVVKEEDMTKIISYNVMRTPALVIDEKVVAQGKVLSISDVKALIA